MQLLKVNLRSLSVICVLIVSISLSNVVKGDDKVTRGIWDIPYPRPAEIMEDGSVASVPPTEQTPATEETPKEETPKEETPKEEAPKEQAEAKETPKKKTVILGFIQFDEIKSLGFAPHLEKIFPKNWVLPKFDAQNNKLIADAQQWIAKAKDVFGFQNFKKLLGVLGSKGKSILNPANLPIMIKEMIMPLLEKKEKVEETTMIPFLPNLDKMNFTTLSSIFNIPTELEWPVPLNSLNLLIPVVVPLPEDSLLGKMQNHTLHIDGLNVNLPVADMNGDVLFANIKTVFQGLNLPEKLNIKPIATFSELQDEKIIPFWNMLKGPLLSKMTILGTQSSDVIMGPVMNLISLPKIILSNAEEAIQAIDIPEAIKQSAAKLKSSFKSFNQLMNNANEDSQEVSGDEVVQEFLNFSIPFVGVQKSILSILLAPLEGDEGAMEDDTETNQLIAEYPAIVAIYSKIELLTSELKKSLESLRTLLPTAGTSFPHNQSVQLIINFSSTLIKVIDDMLASLKNTTLDKALFPATNELTDFLNLFPKLKAPQPLKGRRLARSLLNPALFFSPQRSTPVIPVPLEQFRTLLSLTQNIARSPLNGDAIQTTFPEMLHLPISYAHITNRLPQELLSQPLSSIISDTSNIPQTMLNMNLGSFLDMANGLNNWVSSGNPSADASVASRSANEFPRILNLPDFAQALGAATNGISLV